MRFLFVDHHASATPYGNPYRTFQLARCLVAQGHEVSMVLASHSHVRQSQPVLPDGARFIEEKVDGVSLIFVRASAYGASARSRLKNIFEFIWNFWKSRKAIIELSNPDVVIEGTTHNLPFYVSRHIARRTGALLAFDVRDLWPLTLIEVSGASRWNPFVMMVGRAEKAAVRTSDCVLSALKNAHVYFKEQVGSPKEFVWLPNGVDPSFFDPSRTVEGETFATVQDIRKRWPKIIGFAGSMGRASAVDILLDASPKLREHGIGVVLIGYGAKKDVFRARIDSETLDNVFVLDAVSKSEIVPVISSFDLGFAGGAVRGIHRYGVSPNKIYDYMMCSVPVLFAIKSPDKLIESTDCGIEVGNPSTETVAEGAIEFLSRPESERNRIGTNGRAAVLTNYTFPRIAENLVSTVEHLQKQRASHSSG